jgi:hypothetical protein
MHTSILTHARQIRCVPVVLVRALLLPDASCVRSLTGILSRRWADVPTKQHSALFVKPSGCFHGAPTVKYRAIFLNDEQPALTNWALEKFTNGTGAPLTGSPFNTMFHAKL